MNKEIDLAAKKLLKKKKKSRIPIQRAAIALGVSSLRKDQKNRLYHVQYLLYPTNLYIVFPGRATIDTNGNYDSPIFQDNRYNHTKPLWMEFREQFEKQTRRENISHVLFGSYKKLKEDESVDGIREELFDVVNDPKKASWLCIIDKSGVKVEFGQIDREKAKQYQKVLDEIKLRRASEEVKMNLNHEESTKCRESAIKTLQEQYPDWADRFTFGESTFRFRQFNAEFLYTAEGLEKFETFYKNFATPYANDEEAKRRWEEQAKKLNTEIFNNESVGEKIQLAGAHKFTFNLINEGCEILSGMRDDRTGKDYRLIVKSRDASTIKAVIIDDLTMMFKRKAQVERASETLRKYTEAH